MFSHVKCLDAKVRTTLRSILSRKVKFDARVRTTLRSLPSREVNFGC